MNAVGKQFVELPNIIDKTESFPNVFLSFCLSSMTTAFLTKGISKISNSPVEHSS